MKIPRAVKSNFRGNKKSKPPVGYDGILPNDTSPSTIGPVSDCSDSVPKNILAFRTITKLLSLIQQEKRFIYSNALDYCALDDSDYCTLGDYCALNDNCALDDYKKELDITSAFACVGVADTEVVALVTKIVPDSIQVVACINNSNHSPLPHSKPNSSPHVATPTITPIVPPENLPCDSDEGLRKYIETCYVTPPTTSQHFWMLRRLLAMEKKRDLLLNYVITTCYPKMNRRFSHKDLSAPYINSLKLVAMDKIIFSDSRESISSGSDCQFLVDFLIPWSNLITSTIPNILELARWAKAQKLETVSLYNKFTSKEFHTLLLELLNTFGRALDALRHRAGKEEQPVDHESFQACLQFVKSIGFGLQKLNRGRALAMHLETIEPWLRVHHGGGEQREDLKQEHDEELDAVQPQASHISHGVIKKLPLFTSYQEWFKLMLIHFDAVDTLCGFFNGSQLSRHVNIQTLQYPLASPAMLPWRELFTNSDFDHIFSSEDSPYWRSNMTNADLLKHLNDATEGTGAFSDGNLKFFKKLQQIDQGLLPFEGSVHCEATLASLLEHGKSDGQHEIVQGQLMGFGPVIGASKRCCPACHKLFSLLMKNKQQPFIIKGHHNIMPACSLPPWLPADIVDSMNIFFGQQLKEELITLVKSLDQSTNSQQMSYDSGDDDCIVISPPPTPTTLLK